MRFEISSFKKAIFIAFLFFIVGVYPQQSVMVEIKGVVLNLQLFKENLANEMHKSKLYQKNWYEIELFVQEKNEKNVDIAYFPGTVMKFNIFDTRLDDTFDSCKILKKGDTIHIKISEEIFERSLLHNYIPAINNLVKIYN